MKTSSLAALLALTLFSGAAHAQTDVVDYWPRAASQDKSYSVETPCTTLEVEEMSAAPLQINGSTADAGSTVICMIDGILLSSGIVSVPQTELGGQKLFDIVLAELASVSVSDNVKITQTSILGKRMILSREVLGTEVAQTSVVEMADNRLLMLISGGVANDLPPIMAMIDRHANSLQVPSR